MHLKDWFESRYDTYSGKLVAQHPVSYAGPSEIDTPSRYYVLVVKLGRHAWLRTK